MQKKNKKEIELFKSIRSVLESKEGFVLEWETGLRGMLAKEDLRLYWNLNVSHVQIYKNFQGVPTVSINTRSLRSLKEFLLIFEEAKEKVQNISEKELETLRKIQYSRKPRGKSKKNLDI